jgi:hypothetical protein
LPGATALPTATASPAMVVARMARLLDQQQVDKADRWLVVDPVFMELLADEDSRFFNADFGESGGLRNGLSVANFHGFRVYSSSNLPSVGTGTKRKHIVTLTALLTSFVVCTYTVVRFFVQKQSLLPSITQRKGGLDNDSKWYS